MIQKIIGCLLVMMTGMSRADNPPEYKLELVSGSHFDSANFTDEERVIAKELRAIQRAVREEANIGAFVQVDGVFYSLPYEANKVEAQNRASKQFLGGWRFDPYSDVALESELGEYGIQLKYEYRNGEFGPGCLLENPLRYADLNRDSKKELVLLLGGSSQMEWLVFSIELKKVIFSSILLVNHAFIPDEETITISYPNYGKPEHYQYLSDWVEGNPPPMEKGFRSFGKLFFGDFNGDGVFDIVLWRKYFESRQRDDEVKGFIKKDDLLVHYTFTDGQYKKQATDPGVIKGWLFGKGLTWQKGYPNQSECAGQEGKLIPEMHDPLLNDPEVLQ